MVLSSAKNDICEILEKAGVTAKPADIVLPTNPAWGDFSLPLFALAKERKMAPGAVAQKLAAKAEPAGLVEKIVASGPYLNFWLKRGEVASHVLSLRGQRPKQSQRSPRRSGRSVGAPRDDNMKGQRIMLEMVSPNNNKPLHLGHLRNAFLGESTSRIFELQGAKVIRACLFSDRGLNIAKVMLGYKLWANGKTPESAQMREDQFAV